MENDIPIPEQVVKSIYTDPKIRNAVAFAHKCNLRGKFDHYCALAYPERYIVNQQQIDEALAVLKHDREEILSRHKNDLLFVSMGMSYEPRYEDDPCNHRIRTEFLNKDGKRFFIEFVTNGGEGMIIDHSIDRDAEIEHERKRSELYKELNLTDKKSERYLELRKLCVESNRANSGRNYGSLETAKLSLKYTKHNILKLVNETFGCLFTNIIVDQHTINFSGEVLCFSPKNESQYKAQQLKIF